MLHIAWISDMSPNDPQKASVWQAFHDKFPDAVLFDFGSAVEPYNMKQAAYVVMSLLRTLPKGSVILCGVKNNAVLKQKNINGPSVDNTRHLWFDVHGIHLLTPDNGLIGLVDPQYDAPARRLFYDAPEQNVFFLKNIYPVALEKIISGFLNDAGDTVNDYYKGRLMQAYVQGNVISTRLFMHDHYGNLIFNLKKDDFYKWTQNRSFEFLLPGNSGPKKIHQDYEDVPSGHVFAIFNALDFLEIGINGDNLYQKLFSDKLFAMHDYELKIFLR
ncbi:MAG: SAM-dependent chlorinase/fluorinase [Bacteroidia bacterium]|nr:SAM-dependent chlorinase/fluorinase [Bacteroidia bacterium]